MTTSLDGESMEDILIRAAIIASVALATFSSFPLTAQQQEPASQQQTAPAQQQTVQAQPGKPSATPDNSQSTDPDSQPAQNGAATQASPATNAESATPIQLEPVNGELVGKLDSTSAKTGDSVVVKTKENVKTAGGTEIPKGSKLVGHVTGVQPRGEGKENSQIAIKFDQAELKGGQNVAIESVIQSISPAGSDSASSNSGGNFSGAMGGVPQSSGSAPGSGAGMSGSANNNGANNRVGGAPMNGTQGSMQSPSPDAGQPGTGGSANGPKPGSIVARSGNIAIRMTSIPGVLLANNMNGQPFSNASGLLLGAKSDIKLDGGTQVVVAVANAPGGGTGGTSMNR